MRRTAPYSAGSKSNDVAEGDGPLKGMGDGSTPNDMGTQAETSDGINASDATLSSDMVGRFKAFGPGKTKYQGYVDVAGTTKDGSDSNDEGPNPA